jgi:hypothetical protein
VAVLGIQLGDGGSSRSGRARAGERHIGRVECGHARSDTGVQLGVKSLTSVSLPPADRSYHNFHRSDLADGSYILSIGFTSSR